MLELRPTCERCARPLSRNPATTERTEKPIDPASHAALVAAYRDVPPAER